MLSRPLPFNILPSTRKDIPLSSLSLKDLTARLLCARQQGRLTDFNRYWKLQPMNEDQEIAGQQSYNVAFDDQIISGIRLVLHEPLPQNKSGKKLCAFGCQKGDNYQWISNSTYPPPLDHSSLSVISPHCLNYALNLNVGLNAIIKDLRFPASFMPLALTSRRPWLLLLLRTSFVLETSRN